MPEFSSELHVQLTAGFLKSWEEDRAATDGVRTNTHYRRMDLISRGYPVDVVNSASTAAAMIVYDFAKTGIDE